MSWLAAADAVRPRGEAFVDGAFVPAASGATFADFSSRDGRLVAEVARGEAEDVDRAVAAARRVFDAGTWSGASPRERARERAADRRAGHEVLEQREGRLVLLAPLDGVAAPEVTLWAAVVGARDRRPLSLRAFTGPRSRGRSR